MEENQKKEKGSTTNAGPLKDDIPPWLSDCKICEDGLCSLVDRQMAIGVSERKASKWIARMIKEANGGIEVYSSNSIRKRYRYYKGKDGPSKKVGENRPAKSEIEQIQQKLKSMGTFLKRINLDVEKKNVEEIKGWPVDGDSHPDSFDENEKAAWEALLLLHGIFEMLDGYLGKKIPEKQNGLTMSPVQNRIRGGLEE